MRTASSRMRRDGGQQGDRSEMARLSGKVTETIKFELTDGKEHVFAKVKTDNGQTIPVDFGTAADLESIDGISDGDDVTVMGRVARVNDRQVMRAYEVQSGNQSASIKHSHDRDLKRVRGEVTALRTARFKNHDRPFKVAQVELNGGRSEVAILGPVDRLGDLDLQQGDKVQMLVRRGRYNGRSVLVADQIRSGDRIARVSKPEGKRFKPADNR